MPSRGYVTSPVETASGINCTFRRGDFPVFAYYHPSHLDADWQVKPVTGLTWLENRFKFSKPVLIDPITARIYRIVRKKDYPSEKDGIHSEMPRLPLVDYPPFVTDAALLDERRPGCVREKRGCCFVQTFLNGIIGFFLFRRLKKYGSMLL